MFVYLLKGGEPRIADDKSSQLEKYVADGNEVIEFKMGKHEAVKVVLLFSYYKRKFEDEFL